MVNLINKINHIIIFQLCIIDNKIDLICLLIIDHFKIDLIFKEDFNKILLEKRLNLILIIQNIINNNKDYHHLIH